MKRVVQRREALGAFIIIGIALVVLALPYYPWGFLRDDYGFLAHAATYCREWGEFFKPHNVVDLVYPSTWEKGPLSWSGSFYRPLQFIHFAVEYLFFGTQAYAYLIFMVLLHAGIVTILFCVGRKYFSFYRALFVALLILLHPMHTLWMGVFTIQIYVIDVCYFLSMSGCLKKFCDSRSYKWYGFSLLLFFLALLAKETLIIYPCWAFLAVGWYLLYEKNLGKKEALKQAFCIVGGYCLIALLYLGLRYFIFDGATTGEIKILGFSSMADFIARQSQRFFDLVTYVCNYFFLSVVPGGNWIRKGILLLTAISFITYPFWYKRKLSLLLFLISSMLLLTWPAWFLFYHTRYAYAGLVFFYFVLLFAVDFYLERYHWARRFAPLAGGLVVGFLALHAIEVQQRKNKVLTMVTSSVQEIAGELQALNKPLLFIGLPHHWFASGVGQLVQLFYPTSQLKVYVEEFLQIEGDVEYGAVKTHEIEVEPKGKELIFRVGENEPIVPSVVYWNNKKVSLINGVVPITWNYSRNCFCIIKY